MKRSILTPLLGSLVVIDSVSSPVGTCLSIQQHTLSYLVQVILNLSIEINHLPTLLITFCEKNKHRSLPPSSPREKHKVDHFRRPS